jgi:exosortase A-associated hydrolase 1
MSHEIPINFRCETTWRAGLLHVPQQRATRGLVVIVGGPQYRVGSHRQFVLLGRELAKAGVAVLRFDCRGMGDSEGEPGEPEPCEHLTPDIRAAIDTLFEQVPTLQDVAIWGLCDGASAAALYAYQDARVTGLVLLNPWVSTAHGAAKANLKYYYWSRLLDPTLVKRIASGQMNVVASVRSFVHTVVTALRPTRMVQTSASLCESPDVRSTPPLADRMLRALGRFEGRVLLILSGNDLVAAEFKDTVSRSRRWRAFLNQSSVARIDFPLADHTFSCRDWRDRVAECTLDWVRAPESGRAWVYRLETADLPM